MKKDRVQELNQNLEIRRYSVCQMFLWIALLISTKSYSQKIFSVDYPSQADLKVYVVDYQSQADLKVYNVKYSSQAKANNGLWFFVDYPNQADKKIFFVDYPNQADLKIYFVEYQSLSGWREKSKKHLMY